MALKYSFILFKPDALRRELVTPIILKLFDMDKYSSLRLFYSQNGLILTPQQVNELYRHLDQDTRNRNINLIANKECIYAEFHRENVVKKLREYIGHWKFPKPGTIRHTFSIHGSPLEETLVHTPNSDLVVDNERRIILGNPTTQILEIRK